MKKYYQIDCSIDRKIIGRSELPLTVEVKDKEFLDYRKRFFYIDDYFENESGLYGDFPKGIKGKMYQRKKDPVDFMLVMPTSFNPKYIVSGKVKNIFEKIFIDKSEYHLEELTIEGHPERFYFLFLPLLKSLEYVDYSKTIFYDSTNDNYAVFGTYHKSQIECNKNIGYYAKKLYVAKELESRDIINLQTSIHPFFSKKIIDAFAEESILGYDIIKSGDFKIELHFGNSLS